MTIDPVREEIHDWPVVVAVCCLIWLLGRDLANHRKIVWRDIAHVWRVVRSSDLAFVGKFPVGGNDGFQLVYGVDISRECHTGGTIDVGRHQRSGRDLLKVHLGIVPRKTRSYHGTLFRDGGRADTSDVGQLYGVSAGQERCCIGGGNLTIILRKRSQQFRG